MDFSEDDGSAASGDPNPQDPSGPWRAHLIGERIGHYQILRCLGSGGQATVYLAQDLELPRSVAIKILDERALGRPDLRERFDREARAIAMLDHPGLSSVIERGVDRGWPFIAMRFVEGQTLRQWMDQRATAVGSPSTFALGSEDLETATSAAIPKVMAPPSGAQGSGRDIASTLLLFEKIAEALHVAHEAGVIHRDIKPANIMVTHSGDPVILDFGLARPESSEALTEVGEIFGTPPYMSPEQVAAGTLPVDRRTDLWSLAVSLFECVTGRRPFDGATRVALFQNISAADPPNALSLAPSLPPDLRWVLETALEKHPDRRYGTALDLAADLRRVRLREPILARPVTAGTKVRRWVQRNPRLALLTGALLTTLVVGFTVTGLLWRLAETRLDAYEQLSDASIVAHLLDEEPRLWPQRSSSIPALERWLVRARAVTERQPQHQDAYDRVQRDVGDSAVDVAEGTPSPRLAAARETVARQREALAEVEAAIDRRRHRVPPLDPDPVLTTLLESSGELVDRLTLLEADPCLRGGGARRRPLDPALAWRQEVLERLLLDLASLRPRIQDVERRLETARSARNRTIVQPAGLWERCLADLRSDARFHHSTDAESAAAVDALAPVEGLIPIGRNEGNGLWEFWVEDSGDRPDVAHSDAPLPAKPGGGIVLVLVPGGPFRMGSERSGEPNELPAVKIVRPLFVSKYEVTQGQFRRGLGANPSRYAAGVFLNPLSDALVTGAHPVESVTFEHAAEFCHRLGLRLPSEVEWEHFARGGATAEYWFGDERTRIHETDNTRDQAFDRLANRSPAGNPLDDGHGIHAPVGSFRANGFGLHDLQGNVAEWCASLFQADLSKLEASPEMDASARSGRVAVRGGRFSALAEECRLARRAGKDPRVTDGDLGFRPVLSLPGLSP